MVLSVSLLIQWMGRIKLHSGRESASHNILGRLSMDKKEAIVQDMSLNCSCLDIISCVKKPDKMAKGVKRLSARRLERNWREIEFGHLRSK